MKPFNLEEAKAGKPVCTRDGRDVRIICWDWKNPSSISIIALVKEEKDRESIQKYTKDGKYYADGSECDADLFMKPEKHEGYVNIYKNKADEIVLSHYTYEDESAAKADALLVVKDCAYHQYVTTIKIEWEE